MSSLLLAPPSAAIRLGAVANEIKVPAVQHCLCYPGFSVQKDLEKVLFQQVSSTATFILLSAARICTGSLPSGTAS